MIKIKQEQARSNRITTVFSSTPCSIQGQHKDSKLLANFLLWYIILLPDTSRQTSKEGFMLSCSKSV